MVDILEFIKAMDKNFIVSYFKNLIDPLYNLGVDFFWIDNKDEQTVRILNYYHLVQEFDLILTHDDIVKSKPNPEGYIKAMSYFDAKPSECLIFEDSEIGLQAARSTEAMVFAVERF